MPTTPSRRAVLHGATLGAMAALLSGCGVEWSALRLDDQASPTAPELTADDRARFAAVAAVHTLRLQATSLAGIPGRDAGLLSEVAAAHTSQSNALGPLPGSVPTSLHTPSGWPTALPSTAPQVDQAALAHAEVATATSLLSGLDDLTGPMARLLTSIACSCAAAGALVAAKAQLPALPPAPDMPSALPSEDEQDPSGQELTTLLAAAVAADDAAGYGYGPYAAKLTDQARERAVTLITQHTERALAVRALARSAGLSVPAAPAAYRVSVPADVAQACAALEAACAQAGAALIGHGTAGTRALGGHILRSAAEAQQQWAGLIALPGLE